MKDIVFQTPRLLIRKARPTDQDIELYYSLWTDPRVMTFVGFPKGLNLTRDDIKKQLAACNETEFDRLLIVVLVETGLPVGECKLGSPNEKGISGTDVKTLPEFWGNGYGQEIKRGLVDYLFTHTDCKAISATPHKLNIASQKMQEAVGGKFIREELYRFPEKMRAFTVDVPTLIYHVYRTDWEQGTG